MKKLIILIVILAVVLIGGTIGVAYYVNEVQNYITTDDATVQGNLVNIGAMASGKLDTWDVKVGDKVSKGDILGTVTTSKTTADGSPVTVDIKAPQAGTIIQSKGIRGEIVAAGTPLAISVDMSKLYITANVKETHVNDVHQGQDVTIHIDAVPNTSFDGTVQQVGLATTSTFSLLPSSNAGGNYTKVTQRIPVRISINGYESKKVVPGLNATVKISK